jgi:hypothetical protein
MSQFPLGRRDFLGRALVSLTVIGAGLSATGCGGEEGPPLAACGTTGTTPEQKQMRAQLGYKPNATSPIETCVRCQLYQTPATAGACGGCQLNLGPVNPTGTCNSFVART